MQFTAIMVILGKIWLSSWNSSAIWHCLPEIQRKNRAVAQKRTIRKKVMISSTHLVTILQAPGARYCDTTRQIQYFLISYWDISCCVVLNALSYIRLTHRLIVLNLLNIRNSEIISQTSEITRCLWITQILKCMTKVTAVPVLCSHRGLRCSKSLIKREVAFHFVFWKDWNVLSTVAPTRLEKRFGQIPIESNNLRYTLYRYVYYFFWILLLTGETCHRTHLAVNHFYYFGPC